MPCMGAEELRNSLLYAYLLGRSYLYTCNVSESNKETALSQSLSLQIHSFIHSFTGAYSPGWTFGLPFRDFLITQN
jgi:hypothetical protein